MTGEEIIQINDSSFESEVLESDMPVLVDFWAPWCGPCRILAPLVEEIATSYAGRLKVAKVNVDDNQETAIRYGIRSIPTLIVFKGGKALDQVIGAVPKSEIEKLVSKAF